jgi:hypothetical protein
VIEELTAIRTMALRVEICKIQTIVSAYSTRT